MLSSRPPGASGDLTIATPSPRRGRAAPGRQSSVLWAAVFTTIAVVEVGLAWTATSGASSTAGAWSLPLIVGIWGASWIVAGLVTLRLPRRQAVGLILAAGLGIRLAALAGPPTTSDDLFRYSWDGHVQAVGIDPYAEPPSASQLSGLRDPWLWPDAAGCSSIAKPVGCTRINRPDARTIYPPVAEAWFAGVYRVAGLGAHHKAWQVAGLLTETATLGLLVVALRRWKRDPRWLALYALCPAPVLEVVNNGHVDGLAVVFVVAAMVVLVPIDRPNRIEPAPVGHGSVPRWRLIACAALVTAAALVKLYPAVLLLPLMACRPGRRLPGAWRVVLTAVAIGAVAYAPHVVRVGTRVLGYLPGYLREEHYQGGGRYLIANVLRVPAAQAGLVSLLGIGLVVGWVIVRRPPLPIGSAALVAAILLASSPAQPWYAVTLLALATVAGRPALVTVVAAGYVASFASILDRPESARAGGWAYAAALTIIVLATLGRRRFAAAGRDGPFSSSPHPDAHHPWLFRPRSSEPPQSAAPQGLGPRA